MALIRLKYCKKLHLTLNLLRKELKDGKQFCCVKEVVNFENPCVGANAASTLDFLSDIINLLFQTICLRTSFLLFGLEAITSCQNMIIS